MTSHQVRALGVGALFFISLGASAHEGCGIPASQGNGTVAISHSIASTPVEWSKVLEARRSIESILGHASWAHRPMPEVIESLIASLLPGDVRYFDDSHLSHFGLSSKDGVRDRGRLLGFYDPSEGKIYVAQGLSDSEFVGTFLHEIIHVFQYRFRYPVDVKILIERHSQVSRGRQRKLLYEFLPSFIDYYYEAQAHWYDTTATQDSNWDGAWRKSQRTA